jgi:hypothetical protein
LSAVGTRENVLKLWKASILFSKVRLFISHSSAPEKIQTAPGRPISVMALKSDITIDVAKFDPAAISEQTSKLNQHIIDIFEPVPKWYDVSPAVLEFS